MACAKYYNTVFSKLDGCAPRAAFIFMADFRKIALCTGADPHSGPQLILKVLR